MLLFCVENIFVLYCLLLAAASKNEDVYNIFVAGEAYYKEGNHV